MHYGIWSNFLQFSVTNPYPYARKHIDAICSYYYLSQDKKKKTTKKFWAKFSNPDASSGYKNSIILLFPYLNILQ